MRMNHAKQIDVKSLLAEKRISLAMIDDAVARILRVKFGLGLFAASPRAAVPAGAVLCEKHLALARQMAVESCVLLKNDGVLPLARKVKSVAVIGPLADNGTDQMGCWVMDGVGADSRTPLAALRAALGVGAVHFAPGLENARQKDRRLFPEAVAAARRSDVVLLFLGEDANMSGEAHSRAYLTLPGAQAELVDAVAAAGKPMVAVVMAGRSLELGALAERAQALLMAWHPGTMGGVAIADLLLGKESPSGCLPVCFPRTVGQIPLYYAKNNTGRPLPEGASCDPQGTPLDPKDFASTYVDAPPTPQYPFGFGLTYTQFKYSGLRCSRKKIGNGESLTVSAVVANAGRRAGTTVAQLYVRDLVGSVIRPVKELKGFQRVTLKPGERRTVRFHLHTDDLAFHDRLMGRVTEPGRFKVRPPYLPEIAVSPFGRFSISGPTSSYTICRGVPG